MGGLETLVGWIFRVVGWIFRVFSLISTQKFRKKITKDIDETKSKICAAQTEIAEVGETVSSIAVIHGAKLERIESNLNALALSIQKQYSEKPQLEQRLSGSPLSRIFDELLHSLKNNDKKKHFSTVEFISTKIIVDSIDKSLRLNDGLISYRLLEDETVTNQFVSDIKCELSTSAYKAMNTMIGAHIDLSRFTNTEISSVYFGDIMDITELIEYQKDKFDVDSAYTLINLATRARELTYSACGDTSHQPPMSKVVGYTLAAFERQKRASEFATLL